MHVLENIWWYLVLIGVMILVHELGHFFAARMCDVKVETFSFGFGPRLFGFRSGETDFRFSALFFFGGYVKMAGELLPADSQGPDQNTASDPRSLNAKPRWQRLFIAFAGPAINIMLAVVLLTGLFMVHYPKVPTPRDPKVGYLAPDGPAAKAGIRAGDQVVQIDDKVDPNWEDISLKEIANARTALQIWVLRRGERLHFAVTPALDEKNGVGYLGWSQESEVEIADYIPGNDVAKNAGLEKGDILISVNGQPIRSDSRLQEVFHETKGAPVQLVYSRHGERHTVTITPVRREVGGAERWMIGVAIQQRVEIVKLPLGTALRQSIHENIESAKLLVQFLERMVERRMSPKALVGPVGIAQMSGEAAREGAATYLLLMAAVSLNLAIFNLVPIPILDGGVMLMLLVEMLMRRDLDLKVKEAVVKVGFVFLMMVVVFVIYNDISKMMPPG